MLLVAPFLSRATEWVEYDIRVTYDHDQKRLEGKMQVRLPEEALAGSSVPLLLPMNRFRQPDPRGARRHRVVPVFAQDRYTDNDQDPLFPKGFSPGRMSVHTVRDALGSPVPFELRENPDLEVGFSTEQGILHVLPSTTLPEGLLEIEFTTEFPQRYEDGVAQGSLITSLWHPVLPPQEASGRWNTTLDLRRPARFQVEWQSSATGWLTVPDQVGLITPGTLIQSRSPQPMLSFPVFFSTEVAPPWREGSSGQPALSIQAREGGGRRTLLMLEEAKRFLDFLQTEYGLTPNWPEVHLVESPAEFEEIRVQGNLVLLPTLNLQRSSFLDRRAVAFLSRSLAQLWFGEQVHADEDADLWLRLGLPAFLGMRYFEMRYGKDANIFDTVDWLNPRYREHFYEQMTRGIRTELLQPIENRLRNADSSQSHLKVVTYKTALVLAMLEHSLGHSAFRRGLARFAHRTPAPVNLKTLQEDLTPSSGDWSWFFDQWFRTTKALDYGLGSVEMHSSPDGRFRTEVEILRLGEARMPVDVQVTTASGTQQRRRISGNLPSETVIFLSEHEPEWVSLDPDETLLEESRINNHSRNYYRVRFAFDWKKQREQLIALIPGIQSNAIDGNSFGVGIRQRLDDTEFRAIPGYGTRNKRLVYLAEVLQRNWFREGLEASALVSEYGGIQTVGINFGYASPSYEDQVRHQWQITGLQERLLQVSATVSDTPDGPPETGNLNAVRLGHQGRWSPFSVLELRWSWSHERTLEGLSSDYDYRSWGTSGEQRWQLGKLWEFHLETIWGTSDGSIPLQKQFQLGSPSVLRGYPQNTGLRDDHLLAWRSDLRFPLNSLAWISTISAYDVRGSLFYDQGKIWSQGERPESRLQRQNVGVGLEWMVDTVSLFQVPLKLELAVPINDPDYRRPQLVLLGTLTGS